jgi:hypothetical protein
VPAGFVVLLALTVACGPSEPGSSPEELRAQPPLEAEVDGHTSVLAGAGEVAAVTSRLPRDARYVDPDGDDGSAGTASSPWRTVGHAVAAAPDGATVVLREGTYRESVELTRAGLTLRAFPGETVWMDGTEEVEQPARPRDGAWMVERWDGHEAERLDPGSHLLAPDRPEAGWPDMVFLDGRPLREVAERPSLGPGDFWVDVAAQRLWLGEDPGKAVLEATTRGWGLYLNGADDTTLIGIGFRRFATPARLIAPLRVHADDVVVHDVVAEDNAYAGISVIGDDNLVQQVTVQRNGQLGVQARHADRLVLRRSVLTGNNVAGFETSQQAGGTKITASRDVTVVDDVVEENEGPGIWLDQSVLGAVVARNLITDNARSGVEVELSAEVVVAGNLVARNGRHGLYVLESSDVVAANNHLVGNAGRDVWVVEGSRSSDDPESSDHDERHLPPPESLSFDVEAIRILGNVVGDLPGHRAEALVGVEDAARVRSAHDMDIEIDHNAYWRAPGAEPFSTWADYPSDVVISDDLDQHRDATGTDGGSQQSAETTNPWVEEDGDSLHASGDEQLATGGEGAGDVVDDLLDLDGARTIGLPEDLALPIDARAVRGDSGS